MAPKYANAIGKSVAGFCITYSDTGVEIEAQCFYDEKGRETLRDNPESVSIPEWERRKALHNQPTEAERLTQMVRKYELRLNKECTKPPASGSDADIQAWLGSLGFAERRALLMSQKDFNKSYPEGFRA